MGIVAKQASKNAVVIFTGTLFGALNTILVLPKAFADNTAGLGFIGVMVSVAMISAQFFSLSANSIFVNYIPKLKKSESQNALVSKVLVACFMGLILFSFGVFISEGIVMRWLSPSDGELYSLYKIPIIVFTASVVFFYAFSGFLTAKFETVLINLLIDPFTKSSYLLIALAYLFGLIDYTVLIYLLVSSYSLIAVVSGVRVYKLGWRWSRAHLDLRTSEILNYGFYSLLDKSAGIMIQRLDILMIASIIDFGIAAEYMIAFFIGSIVIIPFRAIQSIANPIISKEMKNGNDVSLKPIYQQTTLYSFLLGAFVFGAIWINVDELLMILPQKFRAGKWIILFIGLSKLVQISGSVSAAFIVYSNYYRYILKLNLFLLGLTVITNLILIVNYGMNGAAAATALTVLLFTVIKVKYVKAKFSLVPYTSNFLKLLVLSLVLIVLVSFVRIEYNAYLSIAVKSGILAVSFYLGLKLFKIVPEIDSISKIKELISGK